MKSTTARRKTLEMARSGDYRAAVAFQKQLADMVTVCTLPGPVRTVGAVDVGFIGPVRRHTHLAAGVVLCNVETLEVFERQCVIQPVQFPYIPGLLSFREAPAVLEAIDKLSAIPDVFLVDGQGLAHPRFCGIACHLGVILDHPTIGCAKSRLIGEAEKKLDTRRGRSVRLIHNDAVVGAEVRTRDNVKPVFVSVGHRVTLAESIKLVLNLSRYRLPEPARTAHNYVTEKAQSHKDKAT